MSRATRIRIRRWLVRYLPPEILGTTVALLSATAAYAAVGGSGPDALLAAALAGTLGENVGYYALVVVRGYRTHRMGAGRCHAAGRTARGVLLEFGPAETIDSLAVRPLFFGLGPLLLAEPWLGWLLGKLAADVVFYAVTITSYELGKRLIEPETELAP